MFRRARPRALRLDHHARVVDEDRAGPSTLRTARGHASTSVGFETSGDNASAVPPGMDAIDRYRGGRVGRG